MVHKGILFAWIIFLLLTWTLGESKVMRLQHSFEDGFDGWSVDNGSWERISLDDLRKSHDGEVPNPKETNLTFKNDYILIPSNNLSDRHIGIMKKDFVVRGNSVLEVYFSALALGWKDEDFLFSPTNPILEIIYDDVKVFQLDSAIRENEEFFSPGKWNQFRLFSSYTSGFNLTISILGKRGASSNVLALDNIIVKETPHKPINSSESEPETDVKEHNGAWERLVSSIEKEMTKASSNHSIKNKPEYCDFNYESGPCEEKWVRYYYNRTTKKCEVFIYGGCNGNSNNFNTKTACESMCKLPSHSDDEELLKEKKKYHHLHLDFEKEFSGDNDGWTVKHFTRINYNNQTSNVSRNNNHSDYGISPIYEPNTIFRRPTLLHPLDLIPNKELSINFSLILVGDVDLHMHPFFEHLNPGFKIYIGDYLIFDFLSAGFTDMQWHNYSIRESTDNILDSPDLTNFGHPEQILRIESWKGSAVDESEVVILDDFTLVQEDPRVTTPLPTSSPMTELPLVSEEFTTSTTSEIEHETTMMILNDAEDKFPCDLPVDSGPCKGNLSRYYFDSSSRQCRPFSYGGCKGNANRFKSKNVCYGLCSGTPPVEIKAPCEQSIDFGDIKCSSYSERYFYDQGLGTCIIFLYSGCGGNDNRFKSFHECQTKCVSKEDSRTIAKKAFLKIPDSMEYETKMIRHPDCSKGFDKGPCTGNYIAYAYDLIEGDCARFVYGGCGGNSNRFYNIEKCRSVCGKVVPQIPDNENRCDHVVSSHSSNCVKRYFYDSKLSECLSGCSTSKNKGFLSKNACKNACVPSNHSFSSPPPSYYCSLPLNFGRIKCNDSLTGYYFDSANGTCRKLIYSGCGLSVLFPSLEECSSTCNPCFMPPNEGHSNCENANVYSIRYYHNFWEDSCQKLHYSGCGGNANNFPDERSCNATCRPSVQDDTTTPGLNAPTIAEITLGVVVVVIFTVGVFVGWKYYKVQRNYGLVVN